jgi:hypothetical protein
MQWWAFTLILDDGTELDWQASGKTSTHALHELIICWLQRLGDAEYFLGHEFAAIECLGPCTDDELAAPEAALVAVTVPSSVNSQESEPGDAVELEISRLGDTSKMRRVVLRGEE